MNVFLHTNDLWIPSSFGVHHKSNIYGRKVHEQTEIKHQIEATQMHITYVVTGINFEKLFSKHTFLKIY